MPDQPEANTPGIRIMTPEDVASIKWNENGPEPIIGEDGTHTFVLPAKEGER